MPGLPLLVRQLDLLVSRDGEYEIKAKQVFKGPTSNQCGENNLLHDMLVHRFCKEDMKALK